MLYAEQRQAIVLEGLSLEPGHTRRLNCPGCMGDNTFALTKTAAHLLYHCYRASCGLKGRINTLPCPANSPHSGLKPSTPRPYTYPLHPLNTNQLEYLRRRYCLTPKELQGTRYNPIRGSCVYPIRDRYGRQVGVVDRSYKGATPKALTFLDNHDLPCTLHFPQPALNTLPLICLTEDIPSASRVARIAPAVALIGCHLSDLNATYLQKLTSRLIFCLDPDAKETAIKLALRFANRFECRVAFLSQDPKDLSPEQLQIELDSYIAVS